MNVREILAPRKKNCTLEHKNMLQNECDRLPIQKNIEVDLYETAV